MATPQPPGDPACVGTDPYVFDNEWTYGMALGICKPCPVKAWCLQTVDPAKNYYDGVVGGHVWKEGVAVHRFSDTTEPILRLYLDSRLPPSQRSRPVDEQKINDLMVGKLPWSRVTLAERLEAALRLYDQNVPADIVTTITRLPETQVQDIFNHSDKYRKNNTK